jgi:cysteinyl-tRNA synthetase
MLWTLGLDNLLEAADEAPAEAQALLEQRNAARAEKNWAEADRLRDELAGKGWVVRDGPDGATLVPK